jgi:hypothetical protein
MNHVVCLAFAVCDLAFHLSCDQPSGGGGTPKITVLCSKFSLFAFFRLVCLCTVIDLCKLQRGVYHVSCAFGWQVLRYLLTNHTTHRKDSTPSDRK